MPNNKVITAALVVIGNEVLSGRTQEANIKYLGAKLNSLGIRLMEVRVIPDIEESIINAVNHLRRQFDHIFTTGGIGPTHDDITSGSVAKAFGVNMTRDSEAERLVRSNYANATEVTPARLKMADVPEGSTLLKNPVSKAPGFRVENVYVLPGVPHIMQAIFEGFSKELVGGKPMQSREITAFLPEGKFSAHFSEIQARFIEADLGSYPFIRNGRSGAALVIRHPDKKIVDAAAEEVCSMIRNLGADPIED